MDRNGWVEWPSKRIPPGGMLHPRKVTYSPETHQMLKVLMDEAKLTMLMRKKLDWCLRSGGSLGDVSQDDEQRKKNVNNNVTIRPRTSKRRSYSVIKSSGDLERERYRPTRKAEDREVIKKRLQDIMEFGSETELVTFKKDNKKPKKSIKALPSKMDILYELLSQIQDREEWLKEMESIGEAEKHREVINSQIAERMRRIESLKINFDDDANEDENKSKYSARSEPCMLTKDLEDHKENPRNEIIVADSLMNKNKVDQNIELCAEKLSKLKPKVKTNDEKEFSEKEFGGLFSNRNRMSAKLNSSKNVTKENMRGFSIEGSPCILSGKSDKDSKPYKKMLKPPKK